MQNLGGSESRITNVNSGLVLEISSSSRTISAATQQWPWNGGFNQKWHIVARSGSYYRLANVNTLGKTIEVANASVADGASVGLGKFNYNSHEEWSLMPTALATPPPLLTDAEFAAFPNQLTGEGTFEVMLRQPGPVSIRLVQVAMRALVRELTYERLAASTHRLTWPAGDLPPGLYFYQALVDGRQKTGKLAR